MESDSILLTTARKNIDGKIADINVIRNPEKLINLNQQLIHELWIRADRWPAAHIDSTIMHLQ